MHEVDVVNDECDVVGSNVSWGGGTETRLTWRPTVLEELDKLSVPKSEFHDA